MKLSYKWLSQYVDLKDIAPQALADALTHAGLEVEGIETLASATGLKIGEVVECSDIEGTHLHDTLVRVGENKDDYYRIVCGAPNCRKGLKVIVALPGATLPGGTIEAKPLQGHESNGMLCALYELGVDKKSLSEKQLSGIEELPLDAPVGESDVLGYLGLDDTILDVSLTPNRSDCLAMWNMAKEVSAIVKRPCTLPTLSQEAGTPSTFTVETKTPKCEVFYGKVIGKVKIGPSPKWMVEYLRAYGMNSINNVVDISNFVMLETGQPLHFYDLNKLASHNITVVDGKQFEMTALDGVTFAIEPEDIVITTNGVPTGIAGIMGGQESMIDESTSAIFIEAAHFSASQVRKTSNRLNLLTEAATRFAKGIDPLAATKAILRCVDLLKEYAQADGIEEMVTAGTNSYQPITIYETFAHCNHLLGTNFAKEEIVEVLERLDFKPEVDKEGVTVHIPSYRIDMLEEADVDEEVIRLLGYEDLSSTLPFMEPTVGRLNERQRFIRNLREYMIGFGLNEVVTYTLVKQEYVDAGVMPLENPVALAMPMSEARKYLRNTLVHSIMETLSYNVAHNNNDNAVFEISNLYGKDSENSRLAIALNGNFKNDVLHKHIEKANFYTLKGMVEEWFSRLGISPNRIRYVAQSEDTTHFHPYRSCAITIDNTRVAMMGELHPNYVKAFDVDTVIYGEFDLDAMQNIKSGRLRFEPLNKFQSVERDIAIVVDRNTLASDILAIVNNNGKKIVKDAYIFDVYQGEHVSSDKKSVALRIVYEADHTLKDEEVNVVHQNILDQLEKRLGAQLRA